MIPTITLGDNLTVSKLGFGGMAVTDTYGSTPDEVAKQAIHTALDAGITFIDTADVYGEPHPNTTGPAGTNEELIGEVLATTGLKRDEIQLATKFGIVGFDLENGMSVRGDREYVREACHNSLRRLGVDHIDLYYMHRRELTRPIEETVTPWLNSWPKGKCGTSDFPKSPPTNSGQPTAYTPSPRYKANGASGPATSNTTWCPPPANSASASSPTPHWGAASSPEPSKKIVCNHQFLRRSPVTTSITMTTRPLSPPSRT